MDDPVVAAHELVAALEQSDIAAAESLMGPERVAELRDHHRWTVADYIRKDWHPTLAQLTGSPRQVTSTARIAQSGRPPHGWPVRLTIEGPKGRAYFTLRRFDETGLGSFGVVGYISDGIQTIYIHCPQERRQEVAAFYSALLETPLASRGTRLATRLLPSLVIAGTQPNEPMPRWPDPAYPQQCHLDVLVPDMSAASELAERSGATLLREDMAHRIYADPVGHPFCLYPGAADGTAITRLVVDCPDAPVLASFYADLLRMPRRVEDTPERVVIGAADDRLPTLGFQRASPYTPPRWGDPLAPQLYHFDLRFDDAPASKQRVERLGAPRLPPLGGTCPVYTDPGGTPLLSLRRRLNAPAARRRSYTARRIRRHVCIRPLLSRSGSTFGAAELSTLPSIGRAKPVGQLVSRPVSCEEVTSCSSSGWSSRQADIARSTVHTAAQR